MGEKFLTLDQVPYRANAIRELSQEVWPEFMHHGGMEHWPALFTTLSRYQIVFVGQDDRLIAAGHTAPIRWDGTDDDLPETIDGIIRRALDTLGSGKAPTTLVALAAMVDPSHRRKGHSSTLVRSMISLARRTGLDGLLAPVRPTAKSGYPLVPLTRYTNWTRADGAPFDPWLRVHWKLGARTLRTADCTIAVEGSVSDWELWTSMKFPETGSYVVEGALQPVRIDRKLDRGRYEDPNLWMLHDVARSDQADDGDRSSIRRLGRSA